jgi:hypothetical protein
MELQWWNYGLSAVEGVNAGDIRQSIDTIAANIASGRVRPYAATLVAIDTEGQGGSVRFDAASGMFVEVEERQ